MRATIPASLPGWLVRMVLDAQSVAELRALEPRLALHATCTAADALRRQLDARLLDLEHGKPRRPKAKVSDGDARRVAGWIRASATTEELDALEERLAIRHPGDSQAWPLYQLVETRRVAMRQVGAESDVR